VFENLNELLETLITSVNVEWTSSFSGILAFLSILIVSGTIAQLFMRIFRNRFLGFLVASACSIWLYEQVFLKGLPLLSILIAMILFLAFLAIIFLLALTIFIKRVPVPFKISGLRIC